MGRDAVGFAAGRELLFLEYCDMDPEREYEDAKRTTSLSMMGIRSIKAPSKFLMRELHKTWKAGTGRCKVDSFNGRCSLGLHDTYRRSTLWPPEVSTP